MEKEASSTDKRANKELEQLIKKEQRQKERELKKQQREQEKEALKLSKQQLKEHTQPFSLRKQRERIQPAATLHRLRTLEAVTHEPTLQDLHRYRPKVIKQTNSPVYAKFFTNTVHTVHRAFTGEQLAGMANELNIQLEPRVSNRRVAQAIVQRAWGMKDPQELELERKVVAQCMCMFLRE